MSQVNKLNQVNSKLGANMMGQQTTRYVYDSVTTTVGQTYFEFFKNFANKTEFQTNLTTNKLDSSESMVIKSIFCAGNIAPGLSGHSNLNIIVGNQVVLKDFNLAFNSTNRGVSYERIHAANSDDDIVEIRLLTDIIIPPQVNFSATLELAENTTLAAQNLTLGFKGYGVIFSAGTTF